MPQQEEEQIKRFCDSNLSSGHWHSFFVGVVVVICVFETGSDSVAQANLEFMYPHLALNLWQSACLSL